MATVVRAPERLTAKQRKATTTLYLAGPFDEDGSAGGAGPWRDRVIDAFGDLDITVVDPRNDRWASLEPGSAGRRGAHEWQTANAAEADVVVVWVPEGSHAPTALLILGFLAAKRGGPRRGSSVVVGGGGCDGLVQVFAQNGRLFPVGDDLDEVIRVARIQLGQALAARASR